MGFPPHTGVAVKSQVALTLRHNDHPVGHVDDKVAGDVGEELLVDELVDAAPPLAHDLVEAAKGARIGHISSVRHCHLSKPTMCQLF